MDHKRNKQTTTCTKIKTRHRQPSHNFIIDIRRPRMHCIITLPIRILQFLQHHMAQRYILIQQKSLMTNLNKYQSTHQTPTKKLDPDILKMIINFSLPDISINYTKGHQDNDKTKGIQRKKLQMY